MDAKDAAPEMPIPPPPTPGSGSERVLPSGSGSERVSPPGPVADSDAAAREQYEMGSRWASEILAKSMVEEEMAKMRAEGENSNKRFAEAPPILQSTPKPKCSPAKSE